MNTFLQRVATGTGTFERRSSEPSFNRAGELPINPGMTTRDQTTAPGRPSADGFFGWGTHVPVENSGEREAGGDALARFSAGTISPHDSPSNIWRLPCEWHDESFHVTIITQLKWTAGLCPAGS